MIQGVDDQGDVFAHITVDIVWSGQQFWGLVDQVGGQDAVESSFFVGLDVYKRQAWKNPGILILLCTVT